MLDPLLEWVLHVVRGPVEWQGVVAAMVLGAMSPESLPPAHQYGTASRFGDAGDRWIGGTLMCRPDEYVNSEENMCAHRHYPCGTILIVKNVRTGKMTWCEVTDRGPYGANVFAGRGRTADIVSLSSGKLAWYVKKRLNHRPPASLCPSGGCVGRWRSIVDLSPSVSKAIGHNGLERVSVWNLSYLKRSIDRRIDRYFN